jgi:membrane fusion protein (multidrug efflux system)
MSDSNAATATTNNARTRRRWLVIVAGAFALIGAAYSAYWALVLRYSQSTDDAYVSGNVVQITPQVAGTVVKIAADDTQFVRAGDTLVDLDPADAKLALEQADAKLARTVREVRGMFATNGQLQATVDMRDAELARVAEDLHRRERLAAAGAVSGEELQHAQNALAAARAALVAAQQALAANQARTEHTAVANHPDVLAAAAQVHDAYLDVARTRYGDTFVSVLAASRVWVDGEEPADGDATPVTDGAEVAVLPPVSGGADGSLSDDAAAAG